MPASSSAGSVLPEPRGLSGAGAPHGEGPGNTQQTSNGTNRIAVALNAASWLGGLVVAAVVIIGVGIGLSVALRTVSRAEQRADANNRVALTRIAIRRANEQVRVAYAQVGAAQADAQARYTEAVGIRRAEDLIATGKLTNPYLQYLAIEAQRAVATSGRNNTLIYLPSGNGGVPLVQSVNHPTATAGP